jgi:glycosyltransferase involved in cell wall biosynthesis
VGAGTGIYSELLRGKLQGTHFTAIEIWEPYITQFVLDTKYDVVINADIREFVPQQRYGIIMLGDILEHMTKEEAVDIYNKLLNFSEFVIISIPIIYYPQDAYMGNPYEKHIKDDWTHEEVISTFKNIALQRTDHEIGIYAGFNPRLHTKDDIIEVNKPKIAVYGIYKNEENFIERFLKSVHNADEIILCDTGSTDQTNAQINKYLQSTPHVPLKIYNICVSPWRFDDARNTALSLVSPTMDICISLDIDEYLMDGWKEYLNIHWGYEYTRYTHKFKTYWPSGSVSEHLHERIHTRSGYTWKLPVHEILEYNSEEQMKHLPDFWIYQKPDNEKSRSNYLPLLEQSVKERKDIWKSWSFLAGEYLYHGRYVEALSAIQAAIKIDNSDKSFLYRMEYFVYKAQKNSNLALLSLNNAIMCMPDRREPYFEKALYLHDLGRNSEALFVLKEAEKRENKMIDYHYNSAAWEDEFEDWRSKISEHAKAEGLNV